MALDSRIFLAFTSEIQLGNSGNIRLINNDDPDDTRVIDVANHSGQLVIPSISSLLLVINPSENLASNASYHVEIDSGVITDLTGNPYAGIGGTGAGAFGFATGTATDTTAPTLDSSDPVDNQTAVDLDGDVLLVFDSEIQLGNSGSIRLVNSGDPSDSRIIDVANHGGQLLDPFGPFLLIDPSGNLSSNAAYHVEIDSGAITDLAGNPYAGISDATTLNFTTGADTAPPLLSSSNPVDDATAVAVGSNIVLSFDSGIELGSSGSIRLVNAADASDTRSINVANHGGQLSINSSGDSTVLTINPSADLAAGSAYYLTITDGAITDEAGNAYVGIGAGDTTTLNFATAAATPPPDTTGPTLTDRIPLNNASGVAIGDGIYLLFDSGIALGSSGSITLVNNDDPSDNRVIDVTNHSGQLSLIIELLFIDPSENLASNASYHLEIEPGAITDLTGNAYAGIDNATTLNFATGAAMDTTPPTLAAHAPLDDASGVAPGDDVLLVFDSEIALGSSGSITLVNATDPSDNRVINVANHSGQLGIFGPFLGIDPSGNLSSNAAYHVEIDSGAITDRAGNAYAGIDDATTFNFTTTVPLFHLPLDDASGVALDSDILLNFLGGSIQLSSSGTITLVNDNNSSDNRVVDVTNHNGQLSIVGSYLRINPSENLLSNASYHLEIEPGATTDLVGNPYVGISDATTFNFTTGTATDTTPPLLASTEFVGSIDDNDTGVALGGSITLAFDSQIQLGSSGSITLVNDNNSSDNRVIDVTNHSGQLSTAFDFFLNIFPGVDLTSNASYHLEIEPGAITDLSGNDYAGISDATTFNFTTGTDTTLPTLGLYTPSEDAVGVALDSVIYLAFTSGIQLGSGTITLVNDNNPSDSRSIDVANHRGQLTLVFNNFLAINNPSADLASNAAYHVEIDSGAITDLAGNPYASISDATTLNFATGTATDTTAPTLNRSNPVDNQTAVELDKTFFLLFDSEIQLGSGTITLVNDADSSDSRIIDVEDHRISRLVDGIGLDNQLNILGPALLIDPGADLASNANYHLEIEPGAITDLSGNPYAGISVGDATTFNVTTETDTTPPTLGGHTPPDDETGVWLDTIAFLNFDSEIQLGNSGTITLVNDTDPSDSRIIDVADHGGQLVIIFSDTLGINPSANLTSNAAYHVEIEPGAITDLAGNPYAGIDNATTFNFTTGTATDTAAPLLLSRTPDDNATGVALNSAIYLFFDNEIQLGSGNINLVNGTDNNDSRIIDVTNHSGQLSIAGPLLEISPTVNLTSDATYQVEIAPGAITDMADNPNPYAGTTFNFITVDTSTVVFDLTTGLSSDHSDRIFADNIDYTLYIKVDSDSTDIALNLSNRWLGAGSLGTDDQIILVGDGSSILGREGNTISRTNGAGNPILWSTGTGTGSSYAARLGYNGAFTRANGQSESVVDLWAGTLADVVTVQTALTDLPTGVDSLMLLP